MAPTAQYPRTTLRTILRSHSTIPSTKPPQLSSRVEAVVWVAYLAHLRRMAEEVRRAQGLEEHRGGDTKKRVRVGAMDVRRTSRRVLKQVQG
ncbi:hypothetical protein JCM11251_002493 [Rhodosporidiobolus azoricus]